METKYRRRHWRLDDSIVTRCDCCDNDEQRDAMDLAESSLLSGRAVMVTNKQLERLVKEFPTIQFISVGVAPGEQFCCTLAL